MIARLEKIEQKYYEIEKQIADPDIIKNITKYKELMREHSHLKETVEEFKKYKKTLKEIEESESLLEKEKDPDIKDMAREELTNLEKEKQTTENKIKELLIPKDPMNRKNIIMEIRAGTGGDEAALFAADLYRMYTKYSENKNFTVELISSNEIGIGGFKEIVFSIKGKRVYEDLRYESGVHRVQRVPATESGGRLHTSAVTVAVLPEAEETDIKINPADLKIDVFRSSGPGGQSVNTTDSAVRITHLPTGLVVTCQDEKSQHKNRASALRVLRSRLYEVEENKKREERAEARKSQVGSGDRSERIRTYNFPQNRLTDHRINLTLYKLDSIIQGNMAETIDALKIDARKNLLTSR